MILCDLSDAFQSRNFTGETAERLLKRKLLQLLRDWGIPADGGGLAKPGVQNDWFCRSCRSTIRCGNVVLKRSNAATRWTTMSAKPNVKSCVKETLLIPHR